MGKKGLIAVDVILALTLIFVAFISYFLTGEVGMLLRNPTRALHVALKKSINLLSYLLLSSDPSLLLLGYSLLALMVLITALGMRRCSLPTKVVGVGLLSSWAGVNVGILRLHLIPTLARGDLLGSLPAGIAWIGTWAFAYYVGYYKRGLKEMLD